MNIDEIKNYTSYGRVCIDISVMPQYSGFVRKIIFYTRNRVCIEFVGHSISDSESGYEFCYTFSSLEEAVRSIEDYLNKPIESWINYTKTGNFPLIEFPIDLEEGGKKLREDIINKKIAIPKIGYFKPNFDISIL
jgi:hypothetical protein